jgi:hypothetical protein
MIAMQAVKRAGNDELSLPVQVLRSWIGDCAKEVVDESVAISRLAAISEKRQRTYNGLELMPRLFQPVAALRYPDLFP